MNDDLCSSRRSSDLPVPFEPIRVGRALDTLGLRNQQFFQTLIFWVDGAMGRIDLGSDGTTIYLTAMDSSPWGIAEDELVEHIQKLNSQIGRRVYRRMIFPDRDVLEAVASLDLSRDHSDQWLCEELNSLIEKLFSQLAKVRETLEGHPAGGQGGDDGR